MSMAQCLQLQRLKKARLIKGKKTPEYSGTLAENNNNQSLFTDVEKPKANIRNNPALTERETAPDGAMQTLDGQGC